VPFCASEPPHGKPAAFAGLYLNKLRRKQRAPPLLYTPPLRAPHSKPRCLSSGLLSSRYTHQRHRPRIHLSNIWSIGSCCCCSPCCCSCCCCLEESCVLPPVLSSRFSLDTVIRIAAICESPSPAPARMLRCAAYRRRRASRSDSSRVRMSPGLDGGRGRGRDKHRAGQMRAVIERGWGEDGCGVYRMLC